MIVHTHPHTINLKRGGEFKLIVYGDVHYGASDCAKERFEEDVIAEHAKDPTAYFLSTGDILDSIIITDVKRFRQSAVENKFHIDNAIDEMIKDYAALWNKYKIPKHRLIGISSGNHHDEFLKRTQSDITERLAFAMGTKNLGYSSFVRLRTEQGNGHRLPLVIFTHHGWGGGTKTEGGSMTKYAAHAMTFPGARIYCYGHDHDCHAKDVAIVTPNWEAGTQDDRVITVAICGSFKRTLSGGVFPSYSERGGMKPKKMGHLTFGIKHYLKKKVNYPGGSRNSGGTSTVEGLSVATMWDHDDA